MATDTPLFTTLPQRALVAVRGADRIGFLQGLVSNDMAGVEAGRAVWAALLSPQGKFLHEFFALAHGDAVLLECERARRDDLVTRLSRYKLRAKVRVTADDSLTPGVAWGYAHAVFKCGDRPGDVAALGTGLVYADPRLRSAGLRWALEEREIESLAARGLERATPEAYDALRFDLGIPDGSRDLEIEKALLLENGFAELQGVDFQKGCYIGQELTARTHYRALIKKRLMPVVIDGPLPPFGTPLTTADGLDAGEMRSAGQGKGLALVRLEAMQKSGGALFAAGARLGVVQPAWMKLSSED